MDGDSNVSTVSSFVLVYFCKYFRCSTTVRDKKPLVGITKGRDKNSYYHEHFLRGLPHLCKKIPQPGSIKSKTEKIDGSREPDFAEISKSRPLPLEIDSNDVYAAWLETIGKCILEDGPKARMPVISIDTRIALERNKTTSSRNALSNVHETSRPDEEQNSSTPEQPPKMTNGPNLPNSSSGAEALLRKTASVVCPQSTPLNGLEAIGFLLQLHQQQQLQSQQQHIHHHQNNQKPLPGKRSNMTYDQTIQQLQMLMFHLCPSMVAGSTGLTPLGVQSLRDQNKFGQNISGVQRQQIIDSQILALALARQIVQKISTRENKLHDRGNMELDNSTNFYATNRNVALAQFPLNATVVTNRDLSRNAPLPEDNHKALAAHICGILLHQHGQQQQQQQQQQQRQLRQQQSVFNQLLMRAAAAGALIQSESLLNNRQNYPSSNNASQSSNKKSSRQNDTTDKQDSRGKNCNGYG